LRLHVDGKTYEFDQDRITNVECMAIEKAAGMTTGEWEEALNTGSALAVTALVWIVQKRDEPTLKFDEVEFSISSLNIERDEEPEGKEPEGSAEPS